MRPSFASIYPQSLDVLSWLQNPKQTPDEEYLLSVLVSCPLITLVQLVHFFVNCKLQGLTPGEYARNFDRTLGRSQGIVAAIAIALSDSWESLFENCVKAVSLMFFIGARTGLAYLIAPVPLEMIQDSIEYGEGWHSSMLRNEGLDLPFIEEFIDRVNKLLTKETQMVISNFNSRSDIGVCGLPESLYVLA